MRRNWTRDELILTFNLYCKIPFGKYNQRTEEVIKLAKLVNRTPSAVAFKLVNFASMDPYHQKRGVSGMKNASKLDKEVYYEFSNNWNNLIYESELLLNKKLVNNNLESNLSKEIEIDLNKTGKDIIRKVKVRINQSFFRTMILSIYSSKCAVSNIDIPELLIASHIIPWSVNENERLNPSNGICLSPLYDKVFDKGPMTVNEKFEICFSEILKNISNRESYSYFFKKFEGRKINFPEKFFPKQEFLTFHRERIFKP